MFLRKLTVILLPLGLLLVLCLLVPLFAGWGWYFGGLSVGILLGVSLALLLPLSGQWSGSIQYDPLGLFTPIVEQMQHRDSGKRLAIKTEYYVVIDGDVVKAIKKDVMEAIGPEKKAAFKAFLKKNKINWKNEQSLLTLFDFFNQ